MHLGIKLLYSTLLEEEATKEVTASFAMDVDHNRSFDFKVQSQYE